MVEISGMASIWHLKTKALQVRVREEGKEKTTFPIRRTSTHLLYR